jgi:hypothetical protein
MDFINPESAEKYKKGWDEENKCITTLFTLIKKKKLINVIFRVYYHYQNINPQLLI